MAWGGYRGAGNTAWPNVQNRQYIANRIVLKLKGRLCTVKKCFSIFSLLLLIGYLIRSKSWPEGDYGAYQKVITNYRYVDGDEAWLCGAAILIRNRKRCSQWQHDHTNKPRQKLPIHTESEQFQHRVDFQRNTPAI